ncbi:SpoIID/LytB domain-containing protein [uncultured Brachyspira sp.]|uniref:SpoIID/LytB domain-containing protein n=1 Tax=uncultured Brachyspira sp. TaxID=221953 RepID=UPI0025D91D70|nr:SpoIID/LytB domain-containing protein [uncultured Brachyspira sp.]
MGVKKYLFLLLILSALNSIYAFASQNIIRVHLTDVKLPYTINIKGPYKAYNYKYESEIISGLTNETIIVAENRLGLKVNDIGVYKEGIVFETEDGFTLNGVEYYGSLMFIPYNDTMIAVNELNIEDYVKGVLPHEMSPDWPMEALKAQAVAARTYSMYHILKNANKLPFDVDNTTKYQVYNGKEKINWAVEQAVDRTKYEIAVYRGKVIATYFSALCGGHTDSAKNVFGVAVPYLEGVSCPYCNAQIKPWTNALSYNELNNDLANYSVNATENSSIGISMDPKSGKATNIKIDSSDITSRDFRSTLSPKLVPSLNFTIKKVDNGIIITGKGSGHGVGMCQWGAYGMAQVKKDYKEILKFYYNGVDIVDYNRVNKQFEPDVWGN